MHPEPNWLTILYWSACAIWSVWYIYAFWKTWRGAVAPTTPASEKRPYASYEEWRRAAVNPETPVDEVVARTPEGFFEKHPKLAPPAKPEPQPHDIVMPQYGPAAGANVDYTPEGLVYDANQATYSILRLEPTPAVVGHHRGPFSDEDLTSMYGAGLYRIHVWLPGETWPFKILERRVSEAFGPTRSPGHFE